MRGDTTVKRLVTAIHQSPAWKQGNNAIVILWDENDYSTAPNTNQVLLIFVICRHCGKQNCSHSTDLPFSFYSHPSVMDGISRTTARLCTSKSAVARFCSVLSRNSERK